MTTAELKALAKHTRLFNHHKAADAIDALADVMAVSKDWLSYDGHPLGEIAMHAMLGQTVARVEALKP